MKSIKIARVKATGELLLVRACNDSFYKWMSDMHGGSSTLWREDQLEIIQEDDPDYWTKLEHQYAGMAMQGLMSYVEQITPKKGRSFCDEIVDISFIVAHALVEKYKKEEK